MNIGIINNTLGNVGSVQSAFEFYRYEVFEVSENKTDYLVPAIAIVSIGIIIVSVVIISRKRKSVPPS